MRLLAAVREAGTPSQAQLAAATGLAAATVSNIVRELCAAGTLETSAAVRGGRRVRVVSEPARSGVVAGIDVGRGHVRVAVADLAHRVLAGGRVALPDAHDVVEGLDAAGTLLTAALTDAGTTRADVRAVGLGLAAPVDGPRGTVGAPGILPGWVGVAVPELAQERLGLPVHVDNDATLGALAERRWGVLQGVDQAIYLKLSDGVGAGLILDGRLHRGPRGTAGEIGHLVVEDGGAVCRCGNRGCLETLVSTSTVLRLLEPLLGSPLSIAAVVERAREGHAPSLRVLADTGGRVGAALGGLCSVLTPTLVAVGGELGQAGDLLLDPMRAGLARATLPGAVDATAVVPAALGDRGPALGAVALALEHAHAAAPGR